MKKNKIKILIILLFGIVNVFLTANEVTGKTINNEKLNRKKSGYLKIEVSNNKSQFLAVGNVKIVRPEPLVIKREDLNITIEKNGTVRVESYYTFKNIGQYNIKSTYMFWLDKNILDNPENKLTNVKGQYIKNIKFYSDYKKSENLRAVINFNENIYSNQIDQNIQRDWYAISKIVAAGDEAQLSVLYDLVNTGFETTNKLIFSFDLVDNFYEKNKIEIFYVTINNKSEKEISSIEYKGYEFQDVTSGNNNQRTQNEKKSQFEKKSRFELLVGNINLDGKMIINFK